MIIKYKIKGMIPDKELINLPFGRQIEHKQKIQAWKQDAMSTHLSQKRQSYSKAIKEFVKLNDVTEYYAQFNASSEYYDDSFEIFYKK